jgi:hypothetical protein
MCAVQFEQWSSMIRGQRSRAAHGGKRDLLFVSHANPEDNPFALWITTHLAREGYRVWCDLPQLLGGEKFWSEIEQHIRQDAIKVLYVLSRTSNTDCDRGFRKELHLADSEAKHHATAGTKDFLIPLAIDDLGPADYNVYLQQRNAIPFQQGWADGFQRLLKKLRRDGVPKRSTTEGSGALAEWWRNYRSSMAGVKRKPTVFLSNWLPIEGIPERVQLHKLQDADAGKIGALDFDLPYPAIQHGDFLLSFAAASAYTNRLPPSISITSSESLPVPVVLAGRAECEHLDAKALRNTMVALLRVAWEAWISSRAVGIYELANGKTCAFFLKPDDGDAKGRFVDMDGKRAWRALTGFWSRTSKRNPAIVRKRHWHFALQATPKLHPCLVYHINSHVVCSVDGKEVWTDKRKMHRARRSQCKDWYNEEWRDRLLAALGNVSDEQPQIKIPLAPDLELLVSTKPLLFEGKLSYDVLVEKTRPKPLATSAAAAVDQEPSAVAHSPDQPLVGDAAGEEDDEDVEEEDDDDATDGDKGEQW